LLSDNPEEKKVEFDCKKVQRQQFGYTRAEKKNYKNLKRTGKSDRLDGLMSPYIPRYFWGGFSGCAG